MIAQARGFIETYGDSRFDSLDPPPNNPITGSEIPWRKVNIRAGYRKGEGDDRRWYVLPEAWRRRFAPGSIRSMWPSSRRAGHAGARRREPSVAGRFAYPSSRHSVSTFLSRLSSRGESFSLLILLFSKVDFLGGNSGNGGNDK